MPMKFIIVLFDGIQNENLKKSIAYLLNLSYLTDSYIAFTLKMESIFKNSIFGLKMMVKSVLEKIFLKFFHTGHYFPLI